MIPIDKLNKDVQTVLNFYGIEICEFTRGETPQTMIFRTLTKPVSPAILHDLSSAFGPDWSVFWEQLDTTPTGLKEMLTKANINMVAHPPHYNSGKIEVIEFIFDQGFGPEFCKGNAIKYISRAGRKDGVEELQDLEKAGWYVDYLVERLKAEKENREPKRPNQLRQK